MSKMNTLSIPFTLAFLLVQYTGFVLGQNVYIQPSPTPRCPNRPCVTLSQLTISLIGSGIHQNISLTFLPGKHSLNRTLSLSHAYNFSMTKVTRDSKTVFVVCDDQFARFDINEVNLVSIRGLHFVGCGGNTVSNVEMFTVEDTIEGGGTALLLNEVTTAIIIRSEFLFNGHHYSRNSSSEQSEVDGGALNVVTSRNILISSCKMKHRMLEQYSFKTVVYMSYKAILATIQLTMQVEPCTHLIH